jgi:pyruvate/2-oxoglutarate/acetoin dehydrogenase E1 component
MLEAEIYPDGFWILDEPICRVTAPPTPVPAAANLEDAYMVSAARIAQAVEGLVSG